MDPIANGDGIAVMRSPDANAAIAMMGPETKSCYSMTFSADARVNALALMVSVVAAQNSAPPTIIASPIC